MIIAKPFRRWVFSSGGERFLHTEEATGSIPVTPTRKLPGRNAGFLFLHFLTKKGGVRFSYAALAQW